MECIAEQVDDIYRRRVLRARQADPLERMWDGPRLFEGVLRRMRAGIRAQLQTRDSEAVEMELQRRLNILRKAEYCHDR